MTGSDAARASGPVAETVPDLIDALAARLGASAAVVFAGRRVGFASLAHESRQLAGALAALGIGAGDRVALWLPNGPAWYALFLAIARLGAIAVALNTRFRSQEVEDILARSGAKALALAPRFRGIDFTAILGEAAPGSLEVVIACGADDAGLGRVARRVVAYEALAEGPEAAPGEVAPEAGCAIFTTSGTTRAPKLVLHTQRSVVVHAARVAADFGYDAPGSALLLALPLCGVFGFCQAMAGLAAGRPTVLLETFEAEEAAAALRAERVTHFNATDEMIARMLAARDEPRPFPDLRLVGFAAFGRDPAETRALAEARGVPLVGLYGSSEAQALFARRRLDDTEPERTLPGGWPVAADAAIRVRDPESGSLLGPGTDGAIELCGPSVMAGYFGDPEASRQAFTEDGWLRTGDVGRLSPAGGLVFTARAGDVLRLGGYLVSPAEIEACIAELPAVAACQVVGVPAERGVRAYAFVLAAAGAVFAEAPVIEHCRARLAGYKVPVAVERLDAFPVTESANGVKVQRAVLRERACAALASGKR